MQTAAVYGWNVIHSCDNYEWGNAKVEPYQYDTEHVLEWSVITNFFTRLNTQFAPDEFDNPDPDVKDKKMNFCRYWKASWDFPQSQVIDNPAPEAGLSPTVTKRTPIEWIAAAYPYKDKDHGEAFSDELGLLQRLINTPAKNNVSRVLLVITTYLLTIMSIDVL